MSEPHGSPAVPASFVLRVATLADGAAIGRLDRDAWSPLHAVTPPPQPPYVPYFDVSHRPEDVLVAEDVVGTEAVGTDVVGTEAVGTEAVEIDAVETDAVAELGRIRGYVRLIPPTPLACNTHVLQINGLAVAASARGRGVGRALLRAAQDEARRRGVRRLTLRVLSHNTPARALYEAEGFAVEGVLPGEFLLRGEYVDDVLMGKALTPSG